MNEFVWRSDRMRVYKHTMTTKQQICFANHRYRSASRTTIQNTWRHTIKLNNAKTLYIYSKVGNLLFRFQCDHQIYLLPTKNRCMHMHMNTFVDSFDKIIVDSKQRNISVYPHLDHVTLIYSISRCDFCLYC